MGSYLKSIVQIKFNIDTDVLWSMKINLSPKVKGNLKLK